MWKTLPPDFLLRSAVFLRHPPASVAGLLCCPCQVPARPSADAMRSRTHTQGHAHCRLEPSEPVRGPPSAPALPQEQAHPEEAWQWGPAAGRGRHRPCMASCRHLHAHAWARLARFHANLGSLRPWSTRPDTPEGQVWDGLRRGHCLSSQSQDAEGWTPPTPLGENTRRL